MTSEKKSFLLAQLQEAIDEAVTESGRVGEIVAEMKRSGYDLCLLLESTVTISPAEDYQPDAAPQPPLDFDGENDNPFAAVPRNFGQAGRDFELTEQDLEFLQEMNIAVSA